MTQEQRARDMYHSVRGLMRTAAAWKRDGDLDQYQHIKDNAALFMRWRRGILDTIPTSTEGENHVRAEA